MKKKMLSIMMLAVCVCSLTFGSCSLFNKGGDSTEDSSTQSETPITDESFADIELPEVEIERP